MSSQNHIKFNLNECITDVVCGAFNTNHVSNKNISYYETILGSMINEIHIIKSILQYINTTPNADSAFIHNQIYNLFKNSRSVNKSNWCAVNRIKNVELHAATIKSLIEEYPELSAINNIFTKWCESHENLIKMTYVYNTYSKDAQNMESLSKTPNNIITNMLTKLADAVTNAIEETNMLISEFKTVILRNEYKSRKASDYIKVSDAKLEEAKKLLDV